MSKKVVLIVIDGWGYNKEEIRYDAIRCAQTDWMDLLTKKFPSYLIYAHGEHVGLNVNQMGNSEVGHLTIGSGRTIEQDVVRIDKCILQNTLKDKLNILDQYRSERLHVVGLLSDGGVHSHINHIKAIIEQLSNKEIFLHIISDGRDTKAKCVLNFIDEIENFFKKINKGTIASISGRFYTMDRDNRIERTNEAYEMMTKEKTTEKTIFNLINDFYGEGLSDENIPPTLFDKKSKILKGEPIVFANFRADRMKQIVKRFEFTNPCFTLTEYDKKIKAVPIFKKLEIKNCLSEVFSKNNIRSLHVAETEKYAHVTYFFNGGVEHPFKNETRVLVPSPNVKTYDLQPEMSVMGVTEAVLKGMQKDNQFIVCNLAPPDMVGHTGMFKETLEACFATDQAIGIIYEACKDFGFTLFITADHGNAEIMKDENEEMVKKHTKNKVPFIICEGENSIEGFFDSEFSLKDVAPTILKYMEIEKPEEMTGKSVL
ncbi:hypothetical protein GVAV_000631 [Gurleya vavrai]